MFRSTRKSFRVYYYVSSLLPIYLFIIIFMISIKIRPSKALLTDVWRLTSTYQLVFYIFILLLLVSVGCLFKTWKIIEEPKEYSITRGTSCVVFKDKYNPGFREFILSVILPMMSTFSINDYPLPTLVMVLAFQVFIFIFFLNSSDFFPNLSLFLFGYSVFIVDKVYSEDSHLKYVFGKTSEIDKIANENHQFQVVEIGEPNYNNNVGVISE